MSLSCLKQISTERDISKISQKHLRKDVFFEASLRHLNYISKKMFSGDVFMASQTYLKKDVSSVTSLICLKNIFWKYWWLFKNIIQKWFRGDKIDVWALKTLKKKKWNVVFWEQCTAINQSVMWAHVCMLFISAVWLTNHLAVLAFQQSSNLRSRCIIYCF